MKAVQSHPHVVFAGGGTGGHLFPGLAVAERLSEDLPGVRITFAGSGLEFERRHVLGAGFDYMAFPCRPWPRRLPEMLSFLSSHWSGCRQAGRFLDEEAVSVVVGLGGYVSVPAAWAAGRRGLPLVLLEQNAVPGRATRRLARHATLVCTAFVQARRYFDPRCPVRLTGNPVRGRFIPPAASSADNGDRGSLPAAAKTSAPGNSRKLLLVLGGSGGARSLNQRVPWALYRVAAALTGWRVVHQSGLADLEPTRDLYRKLGLEATVVGFLYDMPDVLAQAGLAVCRCGGTTLAELAVAGVPPILLPYPDAADDHQRKNADCLASAGACLTLDERELAGRLDDHLAEAVGRLLGDPGRRARMSEAIRRLAYPDAAWDVATVVRQLAPGRGQW